MCLFWQVVFVPVYWPVATGFSLLGDDGQASNVVATTLDGSDAMFEVHETHVLYNSIMLTHDFGGRVDAIPVFCNGQKAHPFEFNPVTKLHNTVVYVSEGTTCNIELELKLGIRTPLIPVTTLTTPGRPKRSNTFYVSPTGLGVSVNPDKPGNLADTLAKVRDTQIVMQPGTYWNTGDISVKQAQGLSLIGNGAIIDGSSEKRVNANAWEDIGAGVWKSNSAAVVDPQARLILFGDDGFGKGLILQHISDVIENDAAAISRKEYSFWASNRTGDTWYVRFPWQNVSPNRVFQTRFSQTDGIVFRGAHDLWIENLTFQNYGRVQNASGKAGHTTANRILRFAKCQDITMRQVNTRHSTSNAMQFSFCSDVLIEDCKTEHRQYFSANFKNLKQSKTRFGFEQASSWAFLDSQRVTVRRCRFDELTDPTNLFRCRAINIHDNLYFRVIEECLKAVRDCRHVHYWNNQVVDSIRAGSFTMQSSTGPVFYVNNTILGYGNWLPGDNHPDFAKKRKIVSQSGWGGSAFKSNTKGLNLIGEQYLYHNMAYQNHSSKNQDLWDGRQNAFYFGDKHQTNSKTKSRNNIWRASGIGFVGGHSSDHLDFEFDQFFAENRKRVGYKHLYPHGKTHKNTKSFLQAAKIYQKHYSETDVNLVRSQNGKIVPGSRTKGTLIPGITGNPLFGSPTEATGPF